LGMSEADLWASRVRFVQDGAMAGPYGGRS
jgi:hypothetical protein